MFRVYAILAVDWQDRCDAQKIGIAKCPSTRMKLFQTGNHDTLHLRAQSPLMDKSVALRIERSAHSMFKSVDQHWRGEWVEALTPLGREFRKWLVLGMQG